MSLSNVADIVLLAEDTSAMFEGDGEQVVVVVPPPPPPPPVAVVIDAPPPLFNLDVKSGSLVLRSDLTVRSKRNASSDNLLTLTSSKSSNWCC